MSNHSRMPARNPKAPPFPAAAGKTPAAPLQHRAPARAKLRAETVVQGLAARQRRK